MPQSIGRLLRVLRHDVGLPDRRTLADSIYRQMAVAWRGKLGELARAVGSHKSARGPNGKDQDYLLGLAVEDAESILDTFSKEFENKLKQLFARNPDETREFFSSEIKSWADKRARYKDDQISLNNVGTARQYAVKRFNEKNRGAKRYRYSGPNPAACDDCQAHFRAGIVDNKYVLANPQPQHLNCAHGWVLIGFSKLDIDVATIWVG